MEEKGFLYRVGKAMRSIIGLVTVLLVFAFLFALLFVKIPPENKDVLTQASGIVLGGLISVLTYYFGSSKDKSDQDKVTNAVTLTDNKSTL